MTAEYIEKTIKELGPFVTSPKLSEKLLSKPPFRFLHDAVMSFMKATGFPQGLYTGDMLDSAKVTDKEGKVEFLRLLIEAIEAATGKSCSAKPQKIVAGHEPENTNEMLQMLASCASLSSSKKAAAVAKVNGGAGDAAAAPAAPAAPASEDKSAAKDEDEERRKSKEEKRRREKEREREADKEKEREKEKEEERRRRHEEKKRNSSGDGEEDSSAAAKEREEERRRRHEEKKREKEKEREEGRRPSRNTAETPNNATAIAGKAPPRTRPTHEVVAANSAVDAAPAVGVIREARRGEDEDGEDEGVEDWQKVAERFDAKPRSSATAAVAEDASVKGALGQQALKAKRSQEEAARLAQEEAALNAPRDGGIVIRSSKKSGSRDAGHMMGESELSKLREQLQLLTKASNPLGKFLEAIHDDVDSMTRELEMWRSEARNQALAAADAQRQTEESLQEIHAQLQNLEDSITDQILKTNNVRQNIIANDAAIEAMLRMVVHPEVANRQ